MTFSEEVELGTSNDAASFDVDLRDSRAVDWELAFNPFTGNDSSNGKHFAAARTTSSDHGAGEDLDSLFVTFENLGVNVDRVPDFERGEFRFDLVLFDQFHQFLRHGRSRLEWFSKRVKGLVGRRRNHWADLLGGGAWKIAAVVSRFGQQVTTSLLRF